MSLTELCAWLDAGEMLVHATEAASLPSVNAMRTGGSWHGSKPPGVWYAFGGAWLRFCGDDWSSWGQEQLARGRHVDHGRAKGRPIERVPDHCAHSARSERCAAMRAQQQLNARAVRA